MINETIIEKIIKVCSFTINKELFEDPKVNFKYVQLKLKYRVLFKILIECVVPQSGLLNHVNKDHKGLMWNIPKKNKTNISHVILEHLRSCDINFRVGEIKYIPYPKLITAVIMGTSLNRALEKIGGSVQEKHLVSSFAPTFNNSNLIKIQLISPKNCI